MLGKKSVTLDIVAGNPLVDGKKVTISEGKVPGKLLFSVPWKSFNHYRAGGLSGFEQRADRSTSKAALGALAGGVLTGGLGGLLVGAAIGGRSRDTSTVTLYIEDRTGEALPIHLRCTGKQFAELGALIYSQD